MDDADKLNAVDPEFITYKTKDIKKARGIFALEEARRQEELSKAVGIKVGHRKTFARDEAKKVEAERKDEAKRSETKRKKVFGIL